jgi:predicted ferric reductase
MLLGIGEIILIIVVMMLVILPEFWSNRKNDKFRWLRPYALVALLLVVIIILSKFIMKILSLFFITVLIGAVIILGLAKYALHR